MSLAVQLWLTPSVPHPAEQLPLFDESGPVCFPCSSRCVMHDRTPHPPPPNHQPTPSKCSFIPHRGNRRQCRQLFFFFSETTLKKPCGKERKAHRWMLPFFSFSQRQKSGSRWSSGADVMHVEKWTRKACVLYPGAPGKLLTPCRCVASHSLVDTHNVAHY